MAINKVLRAGLVQLRVLDLEETLTHYVDRVGLDYVGKIDENRVMLKGYDEFDHHSVVLHKTDSPGLDFMCFKVDTKEHLDEILEVTRNDYGYEETIIDDQPGFGDIYAFRVPSGHLIGVYSEVEMAEKTPMIHNPHIWVEEPRGMGATCFDHALLYGPNQAETVKWFTQVLGLSIAEYVKHPSGQGHLCTWMTANNRAHDVAVLDFPEPGKLHHISFHLETWGDVGHAADIIGRYGIAIDAGPMRHGITRGQTIYFFDPSGNRNETYAGGYEYFPDMPVRVWDAEFVGEGVFYYEKVLNDRFLKVYT